MRRVWAWPQDAVSASSLPCLFISPPLAPSVGFAACVVASPAPASPACSELQFTSVLLARSSETPRELADVHPGDVSPTASRSSAQSFIYAGEDSSPGSFRQRLGPLSAQSEASLPGGTARGGSVPVLGAELVGAAPPLLLEALSLAAASRARDYRERLPLQTRPAPAATAATASQASGVVPPSVANAAVHSVAVLSVSSVGAGSVGATSVGAARDGTPLGPGYRSGGGAPLGFGPPSHLITPPPHGGCWAAPQGALPLGTPPAPAPRVVRTISQSTSMPALRETSRAAQSCAAARRNGSPSPRLCGAPLAISHVGHARVSSRTLVLDHGVGHAHAYSPVRSRSPSPAPLSMPVGLHVVAPTALLFGHSPALEPPGADHYEPPQQRRARIGFSRPLLMPSASTPAYSSAQVGGHGLVAHAHGVVMSFSGHAVAPPAATAVVKHMATPQAAVMHAPNPNEPH